VRWQEDRSSVACHQFYTNIFSKNRMKHVVWKFGHERYKPKTYLSKRKGIFLPWSFNVLTELTICMHGWKETSRINFTKRNTKWPHD